MSPIRSRLLVTASIVSLVSVLAVAPASAQSELTCMGLTPDEARAAGYRVQIGGSGADVLVGVNQASDYILGLAGDDVLSGAGAGDIICGGDGDDIVNSGDGADWVDGGPGDDELNLGSGNDVGHGRTGADRIVGGSGNDRIYGNEDADRMSGEDGDDLLHGHDGSDVLFGGAGHDRIDAGPGVDRVAGGPGRDRLRGGRGADLMSGDAGRDRVIGGGGNDILDGDANRDRLRGGPGDDRCNPTGNDLISHCEFDLGGLSLEPIGIGGPSGIEPPVGEPVPSEQAPQGTGFGGWPLLTDTGLEALLQCESGGNHAINTGNGFYGGVQWLPATWNAAADRAGFAEYVGVLPHLVPASVQDEVAKHWWSITAPSSQWPVCHARAMRAMNVLAP